mgnify:FL=1
MLYYSVSKGNSKTGSMRLVRSPRSTCPDACSLKNNGCYAENFPMNYAWNKQDTQGISWESAMTLVKALPKSTLWRLFDAGDFESNDGVHISEQQVISLLTANRGKRGFGFTHYPVKKNVGILAFINDNGFTINVSANNMDEAIYAFTLGLPTTVVVPKAFPKKGWVDGVRIVVCPAQTIKDVTCSRCKICQHRDRDYIIGFRAHGAKARIVPTITL